MLTIKPLSLILLSALCFMCISSDDEQLFENSCEDSEFCETHILQAPLGSSVLLPCILSTNSTKWVSWEHIPEIDLVKLTSKGLINFGDPRHGRVKAFPNQGSNGNYSIFIDDLENSDLGCYRCRQGQDCLQVELAPELDAMHEETLLLIYMGVGAAAFILLTVGGYCCIRFISASATPEEMGSGPVENQQKGTDNLVYENDDQGPAHQLGASFHQLGAPSHQLGAPSHQLSAPSHQLGAPSHQLGAPSHQLGAPSHQLGAPSHQLGDLNRTTTLYPNVNQNMGSQRTKQRFHTELFNRLRQTSLMQRNYANHDEIKKQQALAENHCSGSEYKNPIYNRSTDQLNRL